MVAVVVVAGSAHADRLDDICAKKHCDSPAESAIAQINELPDASPDEAVVVSPTVVAQASIVTDAEQPVVHAPLAATSERPDDPLAADPDDALHFPAHDGIRVGSSLIDGEDNGTTTELLVAGGVHLDRWTLLGEYGLALVHHDGTGAGADVDGMPPPYVTTDGVMHRLGADARYAFLHSKSTPRLSDHGSQGVFDMYLQAGTGVEIIQWDQGGRLVRPDISVAVGMLGAYRSMTQRRQGWFIDFRVQVARRIDRVGAMPTCSAPCTEATPPVAWSDREYLLETGFVFGH